MRFLLVLVSVSVFVSCGCRIHHEHNFDEDGQDGSLAFSHFCLPLATSCNTPTQAPSLRRSTRCQPLQLLRHNVAHINVPKKLTANLDVFDVRVTWSLRKQRDPQLRYTMYETSSFRGVVACKRVVSWRLFRSQAGKAGSVSSPSSKQTPHGRASIASDTPACGFPVQSLFCLFCDCHLVRNDNFDEKWAPNTLSIFPSEYPPDHVALRAMLWADKAHKACGHLSEHCIRSTRREPNGTTTSCKTPKWLYLTTFKIIELCFVHTTTV